MKQKFNTSRAAIQPVPAAVIACLYFLSATSPAANTPKNNNKILA